MKTIQQLLDERAEHYLWMQDVALRDGVTPASPADVDLFAHHQRSYDRLTGQLEAMGHHTEGKPSDPPAPGPSLRSRMTDPGRSGDGTDHHGTGVKVLRSDERLRSVITEDDPDISFDRVVRGLVTGNWDGIDPETRAMSIGTATAGGYLVSAPLSARVIDKARNLAAIFKAGAMTVPMESNTLKIARVTGDPTAAWKVENAQATASDMVLDSVDLVARTLMSIVKASVELVEDAEGIDNTIENALAAALALELDRAALRGSGTPPEPRGIRNQSGAGIQSMGANGATATYAAFSTAVETIRAANGEPNAVIFSPRTAGTLDRLVDTTGQPLRALASFEGLDKFTTAQLPNNLTQGTSSDTSEAYIGQFDELIVGMRTKLTIEVSRQATTGGDSAFDRLQVHLRAYLRADVGLAQPSHFVVITGIRP